MCIIIVKNSRMDLPDKEILKDVGIKILMVQGSCTIIMM